MKFELVIFDCDGVLVSDFNRKVYSQYMLSFFKKNGVDTSMPEELLAKQHSMWLNVEKKALVGKISQADANAYWIEKMGMGKNLAEEYLETDYKFWEDMVKSAPVDEVKNTLSVLRDRGLKLAVLSNDVREAELKEKILSLVGLDKYLDRIFTSNSIGHAKPESEAYLSIADELDSDKESTVFVGHEDYELIGARNAGIATICVRKEPCDISDVWVDSFSKLPLAIEKLENIKGASKGTQPSGHP
jgi:HAD superfamily hydrolase (TIGR01549 family)